MRNKEEIRRLVEGFAKSGLTRRQYCVRHGVAMTTLDYWRRVHEKPKARMVEVAIEPAYVPAGFALVLTNGRRIESSWSFVEANLEKLIRAAEA